MFAIRESRIDWPFRTGLPLIAIGALVFAGCSGDSPTSLDPPLDPPMGTPWKQYASPEEAGFSVPLLEAARQYAENAGSGAVMVIHKGVVVAAWGDVERKFRCHSVRKSFLSALFGNAVAGGSIPLDATIGELGIDDLGALTEVEKTARVADLLRSSSGVYHPAAKQHPDIDQYRPARGSHPPGTFFWYNNWDFNTSGSIYEQATGKGLFDAFLDEIAAPLGMQDISIEDTFYEYERSKSRYPAYAFRMSTRDMAKFGELYLRRGVWEGRTIVPQSWVDESTTAQAQVDKGREYGYMWWVYPPGNIPGSPDLASFTATGTGGQHILVIPEADLVIVHRGDTDFSSGVGGSTIWELEGRIVSAQIGTAVESPNLVPLQSRPWSGSLPPLELPKPVTLDTDVLERYVGEYWIESESILLSLTRHEDVLVVFIPGIAEADILPASETDFFPGLDRVLVRFELGEGEVKGLLLELEDGVYRATKTG